MTTKAALAVLHLQDNLTNISDHYIHGWKINHPANNRPLLLNLQDFLVRRQFTLEWLQVKDHRTLTVAQRLPSDLGTCCFKDRVNLFRAIITFKVLSSTIKLHIFGTVPLLIWSTLTHAILYIWNSLGPTCRPEYFRMSLSAPARRPNPTRAHPTGAAVPIPPYLSLPLPRTLDPQIRRTAARGGRRRGRTAPAMGDSLIWGVWPNLDIQQRWTTGTAGMDRTPMCLTRFLCESGWRRIESRFCG